MGMYLFIFHKILPHYRSWRSNVFINQCILIPWFKNNFLSIVDRFTNHCMFKCFIEHSMSASSIFDCGLNLLASEHPLDVRILFSKCISILFPCSFNYFNIEFAFLIKISRNWIYIFLDILGDNLNFSSVLVILIIQV